VHNKIEHRNIVAYGGFKESIIVPIYCYKICNNVNVTDVRNAALTLTYKFFQQRLVLLVNTTQQSQIPTTEDHVEKEEMKAVMMQLSANITLVNDTLSKKLQWLSEDESKDHVSGFPVPGCCLNCSHYLQFVCQRLAGI
jgi:hypothetical protein